MFLILLYIMPLIVLQLHACPIFGAKLMTHQYHLGMCVRDRPYWLNNNIIITIDSTTGIHVLAVQ